jgi:hypothetical protein
MINHAPVYSNFKNIISEMSSQAIQKIWKHRREQREITVKAAIPINILS